MSPLNNEQKQLLFDYCIGLTSQKEVTKAEALISSNEEAAEIYSKLKAAIAPLDSLEPEPCPDELVEHTIWRVNKLADSSQRQLQQLLAGEQTRNVATKSQLWWNLGKIAAAAAVFMLIMGVLVPTLNVARQRYQRQQCQMQMGGVGGVFQGLSNYMSDYDGQMPAVATIAGAPWWKVGDQGRENHSNTRNIYLLVKGGYVDLNNFICPCCKKGKPFQITPSQIRTYKDFPDRKYVTYSFQISCHRTGSGKLLCRKVLMADRNPLFEELPEDFSIQFRLQLNRKMLTLNSINHNRRGQNVLFGDGSVEFLRTRSIGIATDDIFTLQDTDVYQGCEVPSCETDFFLAP